MTEWIEYEENPEDWSTWNPVDEDWEPPEGEAASQQPQRVVATPPRDAWNTYTDDAVFCAEFPDTPFLCPELDIARGRPTGLWGAPGAGKNDTIQAFALAVMTGRPAFGRFAVTRGRVIHLTYDMGYTSTALRYRRLANGMGITPDEIAGQLELCVHPKVALTSGKALDEFARRLEGFTLAILDNIREATPGADENDSAFGSFLKIYGMAAERAGCVPVYLHHTRKGGGNGIDAARGSSAITAASGCVWVIDGEGTGAREMRHARLHDMSDGAKPTFWLVRRPAPSGAFDVGGRDSWLLEAVDKPPSEAPGGKLGGAILRALRRAGAPQSVTALRSATGGRNLQELRAALGALAGAGLIRKTGEKWHLA